jgi:hypothetical protein
MRHSWLTLTCLIFAGLFMGCDDRPQCYVGQAVAQDRGLPAGQTVVAANTGVVLVSDRPVLHFLLKSGDGASPVDKNEGIAPRIHVGVLGIYGSSYRNLQVDLSFDDTVVPYSELQIDWNPEVIQSYQLVSYETRVPPSLRPGMTLVLSVLEASSLATKSSGLVGTLSAWNGAGDSLLQQGPGMDIVDPSPFYNTDLQTYDSHSIPGGCY